MVKLRPSQNQGKRAPTPLPEKVKEDVRQCGRWVLRQTKIRKARASEQLSSKPPLTKDLTKKRKRPSRSVASEPETEGSCVGGNPIPVPAILQQNRGCILARSHNTMASSRNAFRQPDGQSSSDEDEILLMEMLEFSSDDEIGSLMGIIVASIDL